MADLDVTNYAGLMQSISDISEICRAFFFMSYNLFKSDFVQLFFWKWGWFFGGTFFRSTSNVYFLPNFEWREWEKQKYKTTQFKDASNGKHWSSVRIKWRVFARLIVKNLQVMISVWYSMNVEKVIQKFIGTHLF